MKARKVGLLIVILGFGGAVETAWSVRNNLGIGAAGCRILGGKFYGPSYSFEDESARHAVAEGTVLEIQNDFGGVQVGAGEPGQVVVGLRKVVYLSNEEKAREVAGTIRLRAQREGETLQIGTNRDEIATSRPEVGFETHLDVRVPPGSSVRVRNAHGSLEVADVATADVENGYQASRLERVAGDATIRSRHGDVTAADIGGRLSLQSRHGDVEVRDVAKAAVLEVEHGDVSAARVGGLSLQLAHGDLVAEEVKGDLEARGRHNGVRATDVVGRVVVESAYRDVELARIGGEVTVKAHHGEVRVSEARGAVSAETAFEGVRLAGIEGPVRVTVEHGGLHAERLARGLDARVSGDDVVIEDFKGPLEIEASRAGVRLAAFSALADEVSVSTSNGGIALEVPRGSRFDLEASASAGEINVSGLDGFAVTESTNDRLVGKLGGGGKIVRLRTRHGDVTVEPRASADEAEE